MVPDRLLIQGRWAALKTARIYLNDGLAMSAQMQIDFKHPRIRSYLNVYENTVRHLNFSTLEPSASSSANAERTGGRGRRQISKPKSKKRVQKCAFL